MTNYHGREWSLWYRQETTEGTAEPSVEYKALAHLAEVKISQSPNPVAVPLSNSVDYSSHEKGVGNITANISCNPSGGNGILFLRDFASTDSAFTLIAKAGSIFQVLAGCKISNISTSCSIYPDHSPLEMSFDLMAWSVSGTEPSTVTYETIPSTFINWADTTITVNASSITDWWDHGLSIKNDLFRLRNSSGTTTAIHRGRRDVEMTLTRTLTDNATTEFNAARDATALSTTTIAYAGTSTVTATLTNPVYTEVEATHPITQMSSKKLNLKASSFSIA